MNLNNFSWESSKLEDGEFITTIDKASPLYKLDIEMDEVVIKEFEFVEDYKDISDVDKVIDYVDDFCDNNGYEMLSFKIKTKYDMKKLKVFQHSAECKFVKL